MELYYSKTSPYARKVRMLIIELRLSKMVNNVVMNPFDNDAKLVTANPLGKVPVLVLDNNQSLFNSPLICQYLNNINPQNSLVPNQGKWDICRWEAMADGLTDSIYCLVMEQLRRPEKHQSEVWIKKWTDDIKTVLIYIETQINQIGTEITLAHLALASAIGYLEFRLQPILYEENNTTNSVYPKLIQWYEKFSNQTCMQATSPI